MRRWPVVVYLALFALAAAFRFLALKNGFVNDHFVYISGGRQMLFGEWPTRDWIDPGLPLMFGASALAQGLIGSTLLAEALLVAVAFGLAAAFTAATVRQLTGSMALALLATVFEVAIFPRTYSYPKIVAYAIVFWLYGRYVARPGRATLFGMAAGVALAFLFRHDHGLFLGIGAVATILLVSETGWKTGLRQAALFAAMVVALLAPYLIYVQAYGGLWLYFRNGIEFSQREASRQWHVWPRVFGDERPLESSLVYQLYLLPIVAVAVVWASHARRDARALAARIVPVALVGLLVDFSFIRDPLNTRLADAIVPAVVIGGWLLSRAFAASASRVVALPIALGLVVLMGASVLAVGYTHEEMDRAGLFGRAADIPSRFVERTHDLRARYTDYQLPTPAARRLVPFFQYVDRCTSTEDRLLVGGFLVEVPFYAHRLFAAGQEYFGAYFGSDANERFAFERLRRQRVPFVIVPSDDLTEFNSRFPLVASYVRVHYSPLVELPLNDEQSIHILVSRDVATTAPDAETGWPCFPHGS